MLKIQSEEVTSKANIIQVHTFLNNLNNFKHLFPKDKISNFIFLKDRTLAPNVCHPNTIDNSFSLQ